MNAKTLNITPEELAELNRLRDGCAQLPDTERGFIAGYLSALAAMMQDSARRSMVDKLLGGL